MPRDRSQGRPTEEEGRRWPLAHPLLDYLGPLLGDCWGAGLGCQAGAPGTGVAFRVWGTEEGEDSGHQRGRGEGWQHVEG